MKIIQSLIILFLAAVVPLSAQILEPVKWTYTSEQVSANEHNLIFTAKMEKGWTVYSQFTSDDGPVPTSITYESIDGAELVGDASEKGKRKEGMDKLFEVNVIKFLADEDFVITQKVKVNDYGKPITGYLEFMTCDDKRCLPPTDVEFSFNLKDESGTGQGSTSGAASSNTNIEMDQGVEEAKSSDNGKMEVAKVQFAENATAETVDNVEEESQPSGILTPVKWDITKNKLSDDEYELIYKATIDDGWAVYSMYMEEGGPIPTEIWYENAEGVEMLGKAIETGKKKEGYDPMWKDDVDNVIKFLSGEDYVIKQKIKVTDANKPLTGVLTFMTCDDVRCLPPEPVDFDFGFGKVIQASIDEDGLVDQSRQPIVSTYQDPLSDCGKDDTKDGSSLWWLLIAGMLGGFAALLTPCVFPMIPITVSFFTKDTKRSGFANGVIYGLSIITIYVILGMIITVTLGPEALQALSTNWIANTIFFLIFIFFAGSFFG